MTISTEPRRPQWRSLYRAMVGLAVALVLAITAGFGAWSHGFGAPGHRDPAGTAIVVSDHGACPGLACDSTPGTNCVSSCLAQVGVAAVAQTVASIWRASEIAVGLDVASPEGLSVSLFRPPKLLIEA